MPPRKIKTQEELEREMQKEKTMTKLIQEGFKTTNWKGLKDINWFSNAGIETLKHKIGKAKSIKEGKNAWEQYKTDKGLPFYTEKPKKVTKNGWNDYFRKKNIQQQLTSQGIKSALKGINYSMNQGELLKKLQKRNATAQLKESRKARKEALEAQLLANGLLDYYKWDAKLNNTGLRAAAVKRKTAKEAKEGKVMKIQDLVRRMKQEYSDEHKDVLENQNIVMKGVKNEDTYQKAFAAAVKRRNKRLGIQQKTQTAKKIMNEIAERNPHLLKYVSKKLRKKDQWRTVNDLIKSAEARQGRLTSKASSSVKKEYISKLLGMKKDCFRIAKPCLDKFQIPNHPSSVDLL